jgi:hypothetical protein
MTFDSDICTSSVSHVFETAFWNWNERFDLESVPQATKRLRIDVWDTPTLWAKFQITSLSRKGSQFFNSSTRQGKEGFSFKLWSFKFWNLFNNGEWCSIVFTFLQSIDSVWKPGWMELSCSVVTLGAFVFVCVSIWLRRFEGRSQVLGFLGYRIRHSRATVEITPVKVGHSGFIPE